MAAGLKYARLNKDDVNKVQALEKEINKIVLAYEPDHTSPAYADLSQEQIDQLRRLEQQWGVVLLAYKP